MSTPMRRLLALYAVTVIVFATMTTSGYYVTGLFSDGEIVTIGFVVTGPGNTATGAGNTAVGDPIQPPIPSGNTSSNGTLSTTPGPGPTTAELPARRSLARF